jgi:hypothetical protein
LLATLLAVAGFGAGLKSPLASVEEIWRGVVIAVGVCVFCSMCQWGIAVGIESRTLPYQSMPALLGDSWKGADREVALAAYRLRWHAQARRVPRSEFKAAVVDLLKPALAIADHKERKQAAIQAVADIEASFAGKDGERAGIAVQPPAP